MLSRRQILKTGLAIGGLSMLASNQAAAAPAGYGIVGHSAPELEVDYWIDAEGKEAEAFTLASQEGKWVVLKCFQSWCPGCHSHGFPALQAMSEALADNPKVAFAGIQTVFEGHYTNTRDKVLKTQTQYDLKIPMGHDPGLEHGQPKTMSDYRTGGTPWMILIDPERRVIYNDFGIDPKKAIEFLKVQTA